MTVLGAVVAFALVQRSATQADPGATVADPTAAEADPAAATAEAELTIA